MPGVGAVFVQSRRRCACCSVGHEIGATPFPDALEATLTEALLFKAVRVAEANRTTAPMLLMVNTN